LVRVRVRFRCKKEKVRVRVMTNMAAKPPNHLVREIEQVVLKHFFKKRDSSTF
jgi:hypothetical protein